MCGWDAHVKRDRTELDLFPQFLESVPSLPCKASQAPNQSRPPPFCRSVLDVRGMLCLVLGQQHQHVRAQARRGLGGPGGRGHGVGRAGCHPLQ